MKILFNIAAAVLLITLGFKLVLGHAAGWAAYLVVPALGLALYLLFLLEGLQVAGLRVKESEGERLETLLSQLGYSEKEKQSSLHMFTVFSQNFESFVTGRQVLVIGTVVWLSFILSSVPAPAFAPEWLVAAVGPQVARGALDFTTSNVTSFGIATFVPVWLSQLLPQFLADDRPLWFMRLIFARHVVQLAKLLANISAGAPAKALQNLFERIISEGTHGIPVKRQALFEAAVDLYGKGLVRHQLSIHLETPPKIEEVFEFIISSGPVPSLMYEFALSEPIPNNEITISVEMPDGGEELEAKVSINAEGDKFVYAARIPFAESLPREGRAADRVKVRLSYPAPSYRPIIGKANLVEVRPFLITESVQIELRGPLESAVCNAQLYVEHPLFDPDSGQRQRLEISDGVEIRKNPVNGLDVNLLYPAVGSSYFLAYHLEQRKPE